MAIALVNATAFFEGNDNSTIASEALAVSAGNVIVVFVHNYTAGPVTVTGITDTAGNTYVIAGSAEHPDGSSTSEIWYAKNTSAHTTNIVTATFSGTAGFRGIAVAQFSGCDTTAPYDQASVLVITASGTTHTCSTTGMTAQAEEVLVAGMSGWATTAALADGTGTIAASNSAGGADSNGIAYLLLGSVGTHNLNVTSATNQWAMKGATFKAAAAAPSGNPHYAYAQQ